MIFISFCFFSEVCVDKARIDEYEQRASELAQKASIDQKKKANDLDFHPTTHPPGKNKSH